MKHSYCGYGGGKKAVEAEDLQEEDVWAMINSNSSSKTIGNLNERNLSSPSFAWHVGGSGEESPSPPRVSRHRCSALVDIPGLSKIIKKRSKRNNNDTRLDEDEDGDGEVAPPHEVLARRLERTRIASHSMCEGVGRTLKGRDLRNAILTNTGFIECMII
ncbi:hypothetical protein AAHA92_03196 [Salvia divinorum]|uniref:Uncharacterized protein n=1 Tax=Salvia divinorum TaxID=28513 RepID=A0ABD1IGC3_SALDI